MRNKKIMRSMLLTFILGMLQPFDKSIMMAILLGLLVGTMVDLEELKYQKKKKELC